jgi:hypothetical protein
MKSGALCVDMLGSHQVSTQCSALLWQVQAAAAGNLLDVGQGPGRNREALDRLSAQVGPQERKGIQVTSVP